MSRQIRRVPPSWNHPRDEHGRFLPLHDQDFETAAAEWTKGLIDWEQGKDPHRKPSTRYYWQYYGGPPDEELHRPAWTPEEATAYQIYETVSEGTPVSPKFKTLDDMHAWLIREGYTEKAARKFIKAGWAPSGLLIPGEGFLQGIAACEFFKEEEERGGHHKNKAAN